MMVSLLPGGGPRRHQCLWARGWESGEGVGSGCRLPFRVVAAADYPAGEVVGHV